LFEIQRAADLAQERVPVATSNPNVLQPHGGSNEALERHPTAAQVILIYNESWFLVAPSHDNDLKGKVGCRTDARPCARELANAERSTNPRMVCERPMRSNSVLDWVDLPTVHDYCVPYREVILGQGGEVVKSRVMRAGS